MDKSQQAFLFPGDTAREEAALRADGAQHCTRIDGKHHTWRDAVRLVRPGDVVRIWVLVRTATRRGADELPPVAQAREFVREVMTRGGTLKEVYSGRSTSNCAEKAAIIRDAVAAHKGKGRSQMPAGFRRAGRRTSEFTPEQWATAERVWCDTGTYPSWTFAASHLPQGFTAARAFRKWGARESAFRKWQRRQAQSR